MNNTSKLSNNNNNTTIEIIYSHVIFSFERKDYTIAELLTVFSADFLYLIYLHNVIPPESPCAAIRVSLPNLNLLFTLYPTSTDYKICYCDNCPTLGQKLLSQLRPLVNNQTLFQVLPPSQNRLVAHTAKQLSSQHPKSQHLNSLIKQPQNKKPRKTHTQSLLLPNLQIDLVLLDTPPHFTPQSVIPYPPSKSKTNTPNASITTKTNNCTNFIAILWFSSKYDTPPPTFIPAPPQAPQLELLNYSNTPQFSTQPINFANIDKTISSELPQPIHTVSNFHNTRQGISLLSDTSNFDQISSQFSLPTASQIANNPFNPPQRQITNFERLLSQANWNHSFNMVKSSPSFQSSLPLSFPGTQPIITLS